MDPFSRTRFVLGEQAMEKLKNAIEMLQKPAEGEQISLVELSTDEE